jgi:endonuclease VIII-like 1
MPELAELRLTADYINVSAKGLKFVNIKKNPIHKGQEIKAPFRFFKITAESRGKELMLVLSDNDSNQKRYLLMTMGMSGHFVHTNTGREKKHSHLMFIEKDGTTLSFVDVRRFGKWKWVDGWSVNRGPDPTTEYEEFTDHVLENLDKSAFNHPIHTVLMNQRSFNGVGNYIRSEVLGRIPELNPFITARDAIKDYPEVLSLCREIPLKAYILGGGQLKDWENMFGTSDKDFKNFIKFYRNKERCMSIKDRNGRTFWFDKKWQNHLPKG